MGADNTLVILDLLDQVSRQEHQLKAYELVLRDYSDRIELLESKVRDITRSIYQGE